MTSHRRTALALVAAVSLTLTGCAPLGDVLNGKRATTAGDGEQVEVSKTAEPKFEAKQVAPAVAKTPSDKVVDEGLGVEWRIMTVRQGANGGAEFLVEMKNLNEQFPVPPEAIGEPTLSATGSGKIPLMKVENQGLDAPLGALATTVVSYTFNTSPWNLTNAEFTIGNAVFKGYLNI